MEGMFMELEVRNENLDICKECGGICCLKCGCDYAVGDFKGKTYNAFLDALSVGDKSIVAIINFETLNNGRFVAEPFLYIRARNENRDIVDLISMKTRCSMLSDVGCKYDYEHRPFGGKNLKPVRSSEGKCRPIVSPLLMIEEWKPYQKQLSKIVKKYTAKSVDDKIREDVENLFYRWLINDFSGVMPLEYKDLQGFIPLLKRAYPMEYENAMERTKGKSFARVLRLR